MNNKRLKIKDGQVFGILNTQIAKKDCKGISVKIYNGLWYAGVPILMDLDEKDNKL